jgi:NADPH:quinone reductase-like Zn-dependent oxidoreductase
VQGLVVGAEVCGMTGTSLGAHAEFVTVVRAGSSPSPPTVSHEDAAGVLFGGTTAWHFLHDRASVGPGAAVLVNGASGAIGTNAVQLAAHLGATVTGVTSTANLGLVGELGADHVVDHTQQDLLGTTERFDVVFDTVGNLPVAAARRLLRPDGVLLLAVASLGDTLRARGDVVAGPHPSAPTTSAPSCGWSPTGRSRSCTTAATRWTTSSPPTSSSTAAARSATSSSARSPPASAPARRPPRDRASRGCASCGALP